MKTTLTSTRLGVVVVLGMVIVVGCLPMRTLDVPVNRNLLNAGFEDGTRHWHFAFSDDFEKLAHEGGINNSACIMLRVNPLHRMDCFSQAISPLDAVECQVSAYVRATGAHVVAKIEVECIDPGQFDNERNYGQLATAKSEVRLANGQWIKLTATVRIPKGTKAIRVLGIVDGTDGTALFDNFEALRR